MNVIGMDIGYSNLKIKCGLPGKEKKIVLPVGVISAESVNGFGRTDPNAVRVIVDGRPYIAGVAPSSMGADWQRTLHADYPSTDEYRALFHATLLTSAMKEVDILVTGLPVNQFLDKGLRTALENRLTGTHQVTAKRDVTVKRVVVVPQPIGGYMEAINGGQIPNLEAMRVLIVDPGFYSTDWAMVRNGDVVRGALGTSVQAVSVLFEKVSSILFKEHGGRIPVEEIEQSVRTGEPIFLFGDEIDIREALKEASTFVGHQVVDAVKASLRAVRTEVDVVLMVGGGANLYAESFANAFPRSKHLTLEDTVGANAGGFWGIGCSEAA